MKSITALATLAMLLTSCTAVLSGDPTAAARRDGNASATGGTTATSASGTNPAGLDGGHTVMRRLTRVEYDNTVRDLLGTTTRPADAFPADEVAEGFSSIGEYLAFSPLHAEQMEAATAALIDELFARSPSDPIRLATLPCPLTSGAEAPCARQVLSAFARRAYRRVPDAAEIDGLMALVDSARAGDTYENGLKAAMQAVLLSPHFIYRVERDHQQPSAARPATDDELATRLSYFLWSSMPDDALFTAAEQHQLTDNAPELERQVKRMLADPKAIALVTNFGAQWLKLGRLANPIGVDAGAFPDYDDALRVSAAQETALFFDALLRQNLPLTALLTADFTFADERLGRQYGLPVTGNDFVKTSLVGTQRRGILTQTSVLLGTSLPARTSPVKRGVWVLEQLLCVTPAPPPANLTIPPLSTPATGATLRQTLEQHRQSPVCAGCHAVMDPLGFGLENFDGIGHFRDTENGAPVDASGVYADGQKFVGASELGSLVAADPRFAECVTQQLLTYAVGRSFHTSDGAAYADTLTQSALGAGGGQWLTWIRNIAMSDALRTRSGDIQ